MNSKFIRILIIINGILIPIFIVIMLSNFLLDKIENNYEFNETSELEYEKEFVNKQSSLIGIPNSENFIIAEYKLPTSLYLIESEEINLPYEVPDNTYNLIFLDKDLNQKRRLLNQDASIKSMFVSSPFTNDFDLIKEITHLSFYIATEDSNDDGKINFIDQHYVYISDLNGENLTKVSDRKVKQYEWVNGNKELLLNFKTDDDSELIYGVYNIKNKTLTERETLN